MCKYRESNTFHIMNRNMIVPIKFEANLKMYEEITKYHVYIFTGE